MLLSWLAAAGTGGGGGGGVVSNAFGGRAGGLGDVALIGG
jgi:hypothetical protein